MPLLSYGQGAFSERLKINLKLNDSARITCAGGGAGPLRLSLRVRLMPSRKVDFVLTTNMSCGRGIFACNFSSHNTLYANIWAFCEGHHDTGRV